MPLHDSTFLLPGEFMKDLSQARANLAIESLAPILGDEDHMILAFPTRVRQALPRCVCHTALLRICQQAILGGLYSRNAQSCSSHTSRTSGLPPMSIYTPYHVTDPHCHSESSEESHHETLLFVQGDNPGVPVL